MTFRRWMAIGGDGIGLGLAASFYLWMIGGPQPADAAIVQTSQPGLLAGWRGPAVRRAGRSRAGSAARRRSGSRIWLGRMALASCGLYLASATAAIGPGAQTVAAAAALIALVVLFVRDDAPSGGAVLLALHAGAFGTALAFFEQWGDVSRRMGAAPRATVGHEARLAGDLTMRQVVVVLRAVMVAGSAGYLVLYAVLAALRVRYPFDLEWLEGAMVDHVRTILEGRPLYPEPSLDVHPADLHAGLLLRGRSDLQDRGSGRRAHAPHLDRGLGRVCWPITAGS